jgi:phosphoribosylanthranilate isomerase
MLTLFGRDVHGWAEEFVTRHGVDLANRFVHQILERLVGVGNKQLVEFSVVALVYAAMLYVEGIGLWLQKRWAEYLTTVATAMFIPLELYEIYERFTWVRIAITLFNIFIVWYLVTRLRDEKKEYATTWRSEDEPPIVKICGITDLEDALLAAGFGADAVGFNFYSESPRYVSIETARTIIEKLPEQILKVGVFVNETVENVCETARVAGLDAVQLHGDEDREFVNNVRNRTGLIVIKALRAGPDFQPQHAVEFEADAVLLDSYSETERGGTGRVLDWKLAVRVQAFVPGFYLAGGLSPENVADAVRAVRPYAVDACSRLESRPGKKDAGKLRRFITAAKEAI